MEKVLTSLPIRFALGSRDGLRSATWRIWGSKTHSDIYVAMRHIGDQFKASLHETGQCNIGYTHEKAQQVPERLAYVEGRRHAFSWRRSILGQSSDCAWTYVLRIVIPYSELRINAAPPEKHLDRVTFLPTVDGALATEFSFVFIGGKCPPGCPGKDSGAQPLCRINLPNNETLFVVYVHHSDDGLFREALRRLAENREELRRAWTELRGEPLGPHFRGGVMTTCTDGSVLVVENAG